MSKVNANNPVNRNVHIQNVPAHALKVNPVAQREFRPGWAATILAQWDDNKFQIPHVNRRADGSLYVMEGQHTVWAYREHYGPENPNLMIQAWVYDGLSEQQEADLFLSLNNKKAVDAMAKFKVGVTAERPEESDVDRIVRANGCRVTSVTTQRGAISAVTALMSIYRKHGGENLGQTIRVLRESFGDGGYERENLLGVSNVIARYGVTEQQLIHSLIKVRAGSKGLAQAAFRIRELYGCQVAEARSAAIVDAYNAGRRGKARLASWWREDEVAA